MSSRSDLAASLVAFHVRLWLGGLFMAALVPVSLGAAALNFVSGDGPEAGPYGHVHRRAVAFDRWLRELAMPAVRPVGQRPEALDSGALSRTTPGAPESGASGR